MFFFGDPEEIADAYIDQALAEPGPTIYPGQLEDMSVIQLKYALIYVRVAFRIAIEEDGAPQSVLDAIEGRYEELFCHLYARDPDFREVYKSHRYLHLNVTPEIIEKYDALARLYEPSAN